MKIAGCRGGVLCLLHIVNEFVFDYSAYSPPAYAANLLDSLRERGRSILEEAAATARARGLQVTSVMLESIGGSAADLIAAQALEFHADLIVVGTHGRRGLRRLALGSDAEQVVRASAVPVLLVRDDAASSPSIASRAAA